MWSTIVLPGLKPSLRSKGPGVTRTPLALTGIAAAGRLTRSLVALARSARVSRLSGNGNRHGLPEYGWHVAAGASAIAGPAKAARTSGNRGHGRWQNGPGPRSETRARAARS